MSNRSRQMPGLVSDHCDGIILKTSLQRLHDVAALILTGAVFYFLLAAHGKHVLKYPPC